MLSKAALLSAMAVAAQANYIPCNNPEPICQQIGQYLPQFPAATSYAAALCSKWLPCSTSTVTSTSTCTNHITSTVQTGTSTTVYTTPVTTTTLYTTSTVYLDTTVTTTIPKTTTSTAYSTTTSNTYTTVVTTTTPTSYVTTKTCYFTSSSAPAYSPYSPYAKEKRDVPVEVGKRWGYPWGMNAYSTACSCFGYNPNPTATATTTTTTTVVDGTTTLYTTTSTCIVSKPTTVTVTSAKSTCTSYTKTSTATVYNTVSTTTTIVSTTYSTATTTSTTTAPGVSKTSTSIIPTASTYSPPNSYSSSSDTYYDYNGYDFYGGDLGPSGMGGGSCPAATQRKLRHALRTNGGSVSTTVGTFPCAGFQGCQNVCSQYNAALVAQGSSAAKCVGVTYHLSNSYCYLKSAVPGNGVDVCKVTTASDEQSAILVVPGVTPAYSPSYL